MPILWPSDKPSCLLLLISPAFGLLHLQHMHLGEGLHRFDTGCLHSFFGPVPDLTMRGAYGGWLNPTVYDVSQRLEPTLGNA